MAYTTIDDPSAFFQTTLYTGNNTGGASNTITNDGNSDLQPDWVWIKSRSGAANHNCSDSSRGATKHLAQNITYQEETVAGISGYNSNGFTVGSNNDANFNGATFVAWQWKANGGTTTAFSESGNNPGGTYQANTTAGFSIVTYTGTGAAGTVTHGLGVAPKLIIIKNRDVADPWAVYYGDATDYLVLNTTAATVDNAAWWNDTAPSSTVFTVNTDHSVNADGETYVAYCFAEVQGYSKFGSYVGNGNADGTFIYTGFKPAFIMVKTTLVTDEWNIYDTKRSGFNFHNDAIYASSNVVEDAGSTYAFMDIVSNGFKLRRATHSPNKASTYIYMAFAEQPFVTSTGVPATAR